VPEQSKKNEHKPVADSQDEYPNRQCGTAALRQGMAAMTEVDREAVLDILEKGGLLRAI
jgi:hypothetical protein